MGSISSNKSLIILLSLFLVALAGGGWFLVREMLQPLEERENPTILEVLPDFSTPVSRSVELSIAFDQEMDHEAVEGAISIIPSFPYSDEWTSEGRGERLIIHPDNMLDWDTTYSLVISTAARNVADRSLVQAKEITFTTNSEIYILEVSPQNGTEGVLKDQPITIRFDRPLIQNPSLETTPELPQPVVLDPPALGIGQWLEEDLYVFYPEELLDGGTEYQVSVNPLVAPGVELQEVYHWSFVTEGARVMASYPFDGAEEIDPTATIRLRFSQAISQKSIEENFKLVAQGVEPSVEGQFIWEDNNTVVFVPEQSLEVARSYQINLAATPPPKAGKGNGGLAAPYHASFTTIDYLAVESVEPAPDSVEISLVSTDTLIAVQFNHPVVPLVGLSEKEGLLNPLTISPQLTGEGEWLTTSLFVYRPSESLLPSTEYLVTIDAPLKDLVGSFMNEPFSWSFKSEFPRVLHLEPANESNFISPLGPIGLRFNQPMNKNSTESAFSLQKNSGAAGEDIAGRFEWEDHDRLLLFYPLQPLTREAEYKLSLPAGAGGAEGGSTNDSFETIVTAAPQLRVVKTVPEVGAVEVSPYDSIQITFNTPINPVGVLNYLTIVPTATDVYTYYDADSLTLNFSVAGTLEPSTAYTVTLSDNLADSSGQKLDDSLAFSFSTAALPPELELVRPGSIIGTYNPYTDTIQLVRHRNLSQLEWKLYRMSRSELLPFLNNDAYEKWESYTGNATEIDSWQVSIASQNPLSDTLPEPWKNNISSLYKTTLPPLGNQSLQSGIYLLRVTAPELDPWSNKPLESKQIMVFTPVNLTIKRTPDLVLVWATDLKSGQPVPALAIDLVNHLGDVIASGLTDEEGLFRYQIEPLDALSDPYQPLIALSSSQDQVNGLVSTDWFSGIGAYEWGISESLTPQELYGTIYTERPIYRPGQTVYFKGVLRQRTHQQPNGFMIPTLSELKLNIKFQGEALSQQKVTLSPYGTFFGDFTLAEDADTGYYELSLEQEEIGQCYTDYCFWESVGSSFQVAEYQRPEFEVAVEMEQAAVVQGEELHANVSANYYFGGVLSEAPLTWRLTSRDYYFELPSLNGYWSWQDWDQQNSPLTSSDVSSVIDEGQSLLSQAGKSTITLETTLSPTTITPQRHAISQIYTFEADVRDLNNSIISNRSQTIIHAADYYVGLNLDQYLGNVGEPFSINIATADTTGELSGGRELSVEFYQREWYSVREEADDGIFWTTSFSDTLVATSKAKTDEQGYATATFTPKKGGSYTVLVLGQDNHAHEVRSRHFFWVADKNYVAWQRDNNQRIELVADKELYEVGDVARILIPTPFESMTALITQEQLTIQDAKIETLASTAELLELPITEEMIPNVVVSVVAMTGMSSQTPLPEFYVGNINLNIANQQKKLSLELLPLDMNPEKPPQPGDEARFKIQVKDASGKAVQAELSLAVVDKALLSLSDVQQPTLLDAFYSSRPLAVRTAVSLIANVDRLTQRLATATKGGGGAELSQFGPEFLRSKFSETAYWKADLVTNQQGEAEVSFILPDNLTTWTLTAQAISDHQDDDRANGPLVGWQQEELITTLPLFVRPTLPRFFVVGDRAELGVVVHNNTSSAIDGEVTFKAEGFIEGGEAVKALTIPAGERKPLSFPVEVLDSKQLAKLALEEATITVSIEGGGYRDQVEQKSPIYDLTTPEVVASGGVLREGEGATVETISLPEESNAEDAELALELAPSLAGATQSSLDWLDNYEYANTEWVASILLSHVATIRVANQLTTQKVQPSTLSDSRSEVSTAVQNLLTWQNNDGGWGWWRGDSSQEWLTAYALLALDQAKQAGFEVAEERLARATRYLERWLSRTADLSDNATLDRRAFLLYVLSEEAKADSSSQEEAEADDISRAVALFEQHSLLNDDGKAFLLMTLDNAPHDSNHELKRYIDTLAAELTANAHLSATGTHWEERELDPWAFDSSTRTTAIVLRALSHIERTQILLPQTVYWLMNARRAAYWETTQATAWSLLGLSDYMLASGELEADFNYQVTLNDDVLLKKQATQENLADPVTLNLDLTALLLGEHAKEKRLIIERQPPTASQSGKGQLYYSTWLRYTLPADTITARFEGISVARQYEAVNNRTLQSTGVQVEQTSVGEVIQVHLTINAPNDLYFFTLEDPIPAGFEVIDPSLLTSSEQVSLPQLERIKANLNRFWYDAWSQTVIRDNKIALFSDLLPRGTYEYSYLIRATIPGEYNILPAIAYEQYHPEVFGRSAVGRFTVEP